MKTLEQQRPPLLGIRFKIANAYNNLAQIVTIFALSVPFRKEIACNAYNNPSTWPLAAAPSSSQHVSRMDTPCVQIVTFSKGVELKIVTFLDHDRARTGPGAQNRYFFNKS